MTISEMHIAVKLGLDKTSSLELPSFEPEEIDFWLNKAILQFVKTRYSGSNIKGESFEQSQKRIDDLRTLVKDAQVSITGGTSEAGGQVKYRANLSTVGDYLFPVLEEVLISFYDSYSNSTITLRTGVTECTANTYNSQIDNPFSEHILYLKKAKPLRLFKENFAEFTVSGNGEYAVLTYYLRYIKQPATVSLSTNVSCDLSSHTHQEIVDMCVAMLLENIESIRYQSFKQESLVNE